MAGSGEWVAVTAGFFLAVAANVVGVTVGVGFGLYLGEQVAPQLLPLSVLFGQVGAVVLTGFLVRRRRSLLKGVWIGGAISLIMAVTCAGYILSLG